MSDMLEAGVPAVEVMTEYVRACRRLGHSVPEPADLFAAYTAEDGLDLLTLDADHRTLAAALAEVEEALSAQEHARGALAAAWRGVGAEAAAEHLLRHAEAAHAGVDGLRGAVAAIDELRNRLWQLVDAKVGGTQDIEARGMRAEWLSASRTVGTGAGDRSVASETVDMQVAPFVADDIACEWITSMRDTEAAIRQAYRDAAATMAAQVPPAFGQPGLPGAVAAEGISAAPAPVAPAGFVPGAAAPPPPMAAPPMAPPPPMAAPPMAPPPPSPPPMAEPVGAAPAAAPMPAGASPLGSGMSGLSGLGRPFADLLGGLLGSGGGGFGEGLNAAGDLDSVLDDGREELEREDPPEEDEEADDEDGDDEDGEDAVGEPVPEEVLAPAEQETPAESLAPVAVTPEEPIATPVPEPQAEPVAAPSEPAPADTPCEIAADELPQAGP